MRVVDTGVYHYHHSCSGGEYTGRLDGHWTQHDQPRYGEKERGKERRDREEGGEIEEGGREKEREDGREGGREREGERKRRDKVKNKL